MKTRSMVDAIAAMDAAAEAAAQRAQAALEEDADAWRFADITDSSARQITIVVPGPPPRKNRRTRTVIDAGGDVLHIDTKRWRQWRKALATAATIARASYVCAGRWELHLQIYEKAMRHLDVDVPLGDVDSSLSCVLDGLQRVLVLDDDARIVAGSFRKHFDPKCPRVEITLQRE